MSEFNNQADADSQVIQSLVRHIRKLEREYMSKIVFDGNGNVYKVKADELDQISYSELNDKIERLNHDKKELERVSKMASELSNGQDQPSQPAPQPQPEQPSQPEQPQQTPQPAEQPVNPAPLNLG